MFILSAAQALNVKQEACDIKQFRPFLLRLPPNGRGILGGCRCIWVEFLLSDPVRI